MRKKIAWFVTFIVAMSLVFCFLGCKDPEPIPDTTPPAEVTNFSYLVDEYGLHLSWVNPTDKDFVGVKLEINGSNGTKYEGPVKSDDTHYFLSRDIISSGVYVIRVQTYDSSYNYSNGVSIMVTIEWEDITPPAQVTNFLVKYSALEKSIIVSWENPQDEDFAGTEVVYGKTDFSLVETLEFEKSYFSAIINEIPSDDSEYFVKIRTKDTSENFSEYIEKTLRAENSNVNTDSTPPAQVTNLSAVYSALETSILVSWENPQDEDFSGTVLEYGKTSSTEKTTLTFDKSYSSTVIQGIAADDSEYVISVRTKDDSENIGEAVTITVYAINDIIPECDVRTGDYVLSKNTYVRHEYFTELTQEERNSIVGIVLVPDSGVPVILGIEFPETELSWATTGTAGENSYFTDIAVKVNESSSDYTFSGDLDGRDNWDYISNIDSTGSQNAVTNYPVFYFANMYAAVAGLMGTDFADGWYVPSISELFEISKNMDILKDSLRNLDIIPFSLGHGDSILLWSSSQSFSLDHSAYQLEYSRLYNDYYFSIVNTSRGYSKYSKVWVFHEFDVRKITKYENYGIPSIDSIQLETFTIGETYTGTIPVRITGINLLAYEITSQDSNISNVNYISNTEATAEINCNNSVGSHLVTINCGKATGTATYNVVEAEKCFTVGDILFTDGTRMKAEDVQYGVPDEQISKALGVIVSTSYDGGVGKAVGLQKGTNLMWAPSGTTGYSTNFTEIQGTTTSGDMDGSDNWEYICSVDPTGTLNAATNYPAFNFANTYGTTAGLTGTDYEDGWYLPAIAELKSVYDNRHIVAESLSAVGGAETLGSGYYWSSSQFSSDYDYAYILYFGNGDVYSNTRNSSDDVLVLQAFNVEQFNDYEVTTVPYIISIEIETAGEGYTGELPVTIKGGYLKGHPITCSDTTISNLNYLSDNKVTATITCDGFVVDKTITISVGSRTAKGTVKVLSSENCISDTDIGKIVLLDGSFVSKEEFNSETMTAIAVIVDHKYNGSKALGVGLYQRDYLDWATTDSIGYNTNFAKIQSSYSSNNDDYIFTGDVEGSDNWEYISAVDPIGSADATANYPVFDHANKYGTYEFIGLIGTVYETGWFVPSLSEIYNIYKNIDLIEDSLSIVNADLIPSYVVSSSQYPSNPKYVYTLDSRNGEITPFNKDSGFSVLVLRVFNVQ